MVEPTGIEPVTQRCERCVIPLYYGPDFNRFTHRYKECDILYNGLTYFGKFKVSLPSSS